MWLVTLLVQAAAPAPQYLFVEDPSRLANVVTCSGSPRKDYILEVNGGGLALADFDGDAAPDLVVVDGAELDAARQGKPGLPPRLFLNDGQGRFRPTGDPWKMASGTWGMGCTVGDVDGDGWLDLVVTQWGPTRLFLNQAGKGLREATAEAGFGAPTWGSSAAFLDADRDGRLDLALACYLDFDFATIPAPGGACRWKGHDVMCGPEGLTPLHDRFYRGLGAGKFEDVTLKVGYRPKEPAFALGVMPLDYDLDGDTDVYVANDSTPNHLWENRGDGTFTEVGFQRGVSHDASGREQASMGIGCGDVDGDGREDLLVTNFSGENNCLYLSKREQAFREASFACGIGGPSLPFLGWGSALADLDLDGDLDGCVFNGHVYPQADRPGTDTTYAQVDHLYRNDGKGRFSFEALSASPPKVSRASAVADIDSDGDLDLVALELDGAVRVLVNQTRVPASKAGPHWLRVQLRRASGNRFALGASVRAEWEGGARRAELRTSGGYQAACPPEVHFGLGAAARVRRLVVTWPSGKTQELADLEADRLLILEESP